VKPNKLLHRSQNIPGQETSTVIILIGKGYRIQIEALPMDDQVLLLDILQKRLTQQKRDQLRHEIAEAEQDYVDGNVKRGSVANFMAKLDA
jgi:hypothetical protein